MEQHQEYDANTFLRTSIEMATPLPLTLRFPDFVTSTVAILLFITTSPVSLKVISPRKVHRLDVFLARILRSCWMPGKLLHLVISAGLPCSKQMR